MAWNEPGNGPKNPWGKRPSKDGRSEDALKNFQRKIEGILKGAGVGSGGEEGAEGWAGFHAEGNQVVALE